MVQHILTFLQAFLVIFNIWIALFSISYTTLQITFHLTRLCSVNEVKYFSH